MEPGSDGQSSVSGSQDGAHVLDYLANFIENSLDAIVASDSQGRIVFWNRAAERTFGWSAREAFTRSETELFWPTNISHDREEQRQSQLRLERGEVVKGEEVVRRKDGSPLWVAYTIRTVIGNGNDNGIAGYVAVYRDISERKRAEEQLRITLESIGDGFFACDAGWRFIYVNAPAERLLGIKREEVLDANYWDVFPLTLGTNLEREYLCAASGDVRDFEHFYEPWGRWFHHRCFPREGGGISVYFEDITERKQAEEILHRFELLSEHGRDIILFLRREDGRILEANAAAVREYGYSRSELLALTIRDLRTHPTQSLIEEQLAQAEAGGTLFESVHRRKDGSTFPVEVSSTGTTVGGVRTLVHIVRDITERKQAEEQLDRSNRRLGEILASIQDDFYVLDRDWKFVFTSRTFTSRIGKEPEDFIGNNIWEMFPKHVGGVLYENFHLAMEKRQVHRFEIPGSYTDAWYRMTAFPSPEGITVFGTDITERKRAEQALHESEERYRNLVKFAPAGIYEIDIATRRFIEVNDIMCEILGYTREELLAMLPEELLDEEGRERFRQRMFQTLAGKKVSEQTEYRVKARDGREVWAILNTNVNFVGGKARSISVIAHDITERKHAEELLRESKERYETLFNSISEGFAHYKGIYNDAGELVDILVLDINPAGAEMSGVDREAQIGKTWKQVWPGVEAALFAIYEQVDRAGEGLRFDHHSSITDRVYQISVNRIKPGELVATFFDTTEIIQAEKTLARQSELLQRVFENIPVLLIMWDPHLKQFTLNQHAQTVLGWTTAEANLGDFMSRVYPDPAYREEVSAYMQSLTSGFRELISNTRDGEPIPIDWANIRLADDTMIGIGVDLRERKRAEEALRVKTQEIETILQVSPIAFFVSYDPECRHITANPAGYRLVKLSQDPDRNISKSAPLEERPTYRVFRDGVELASQDLPMQKAARLGMDVLEESLELRFEDGSSKYIYSYARPLLDANGKPRGAIAAMLDITERKQAEEALRESEERFRTLANTVPAIVWTSAPDGRILFTNEFWHTYTGSPFEQTGNNWADFLHPDDSDRGATAWKDATENIGDYFLESRIRRHDGQYRWFQARALPVRDSSGNVTVWYGVSVDIHDRIEALHALRESQQQLQFLNESLEQKVKEQTAEMRRLTASLTKAEQRERNRIAHILHDDLQQRLYAVKMRLNFLTHGRTVDEAIEKEVAELDKQLAEILLLTRHLTIEMSPPVLRDEGLRQAIEWLAFQMDEKLGMRVEVRAEESFAIADEAIQVLLFNCVRELLFNIVKHAGVNRADVSLRRAGDQLRIEVWDEGKGFDVSALFANNKDDTDDDMEEVKATFGLPTLRHQLSLLGGRMDIESEPGAGTRILITVPYS